MGIDTIQLFVYIFRAVSRRTTTTTTVSYKETSDVEKTDSSDLLEIEGAEPEIPVEEEKFETIEKVLSQRRGKKGGQFGSYSSCYNFIVLLHSMHVWRYSYGKCYYLLLH